MNGKFIVIEGLDGSGKTTQLTALAQNLRALGYAVAETAEPTASTTGGLARDALSGFTPRTGAEIAALFMADRVAHNVNPINGIGKLLSEGRIVLCDRYYPFLARLPGHRDRPGMGVPYQYRLPGDPKARPLRVS